MANQMFLLAKSFILAKLRKMHQSFLSQETSLPPILYFLIFIYFHASLERPLPQLPQFLLGLAFTSLLVCNFNFLYIMPISLDLPLLVEVPLLAIIFFFCNQKWKALLFILALGERIFQQQSQFYFLMTFSFFICFQIYQNLVFKTIKYNVQFFVAMLAIGFYYLFLIISKNNGLNISVQLMIVLIIALSSLAHSFINRRIRKLFSTNPDLIYSGRMMAHYLKILEETQDVNLIQTMIFIHKEQCTKESCFCHTDSYRRQTTFFIRQLYQNAMNRFRGSSSDSLLHENYIQFLMKNKQMIKALHELSQWQAKNFFSWIGWQRTLAKISEQIKKENSSNIYEKHYQYALQYDQHYRWMAQEINRVLNLKLQFWREVNRQESKVSRMQKLGSEIITRMGNLNLFYNKTVKKYERSLFLFDITALYAMYMLSTTNFKEYSQMIIKNTVKLFQDVFVFQNNASQTFVIQTTIKQEAKNLHINHLQGSLDSLGKINSQRKIVEGSNNKRQFKLMINSVSNGICKGINIPRSDLVGRELLSIIPNGYKEVHRARLSYILNLDDESIKEVIPSKMIHKEIQLPIRGANGQLIMGFIWIKLQMDVTEGVSFISMVKITRQQCLHALLDIEGRVTQSEEGFYMDVIQHRQIKQYLRQIKISWEKEKLIPFETLNLIINTVSYTITISSPLMGIFLKNQNLKKSSPPIHVEISYESSNNRVTADKCKFNKIGKQIKNMQTVIKKTTPNFDTNSSVVSSKSISSATIIVSNFLQNNNSPFYRYLKFFYIFIVVISVIAQVGIFFASELSWDVTSPLYNPISDAINMYSIQLTTMKAFLTVNEQQKYLYELDETLQTQISEYFGSSNYTGSSIIFNAQMEETLRECLSYAASYSSILNKPALIERLMKQLSVWINIGQSAFSLNLTYSELMMIYLTDLNLMGHLELNNTLIGKSLNLQILQAQNASFISLLIDESIKDNQISTKIVRPLMVLAIIILLILLRILFKKRLQLHQKIFDILVSIESWQVADQIQSLDYVCKILMNHQKSNEIMKLNMLDYQENAIHRKERKRLSADNQMILGLKQHDALLEQTEIKSIRMIQSNRKISENLEDIESASTPSSHTLKMQTMGFKEKLKQTKELNNTKRVPLNVQNKSVCSKRKRLGELDLNGSILDPNRKIIKEHCILYLLAISFCFLLLASFMDQLQFNSAYLAQKNKIIKICNDQVTFQLGLLSIRTFITEDSSIEDSQLPNNLTLFSQFIEQFLVYSYYDGLTSASEIITNCSSNITLQSPTYYKYCQYDYSEIILKGQLGALVKEFTQLRYMALIDSSNFNKTLIDSNVIQKWYYLESLNLRLQEFVLLKVQLLSEHLLEIGQNYEEKKEILLFVSCLWGIVCFVCGLIIILRMKSQYFMEVYMISFLNSEMISTNKRVESYLNLIAKSSSS